MPDKELPLDDAFLDQARRELLENLQEGGPALNWSKLESHAHGQLDQEVALHVITFRRWFNAWSALKDGAEPPTDETLLLLYLHDGLTPEEDADIDRKCSRYKNWQDAMEAA